ncbi:MAG: type 4a pilus biogenesis protein PilO [Methylobacter sp.]|nr:type 4a pilus biogenesis protein PilO [Methylobacter sp.]MDP2098889.1 type 4a pilus biogenesis protein PilO [Methylobacter sp.]MDP2428185.1 type 4a pilus biogenesis protein PilO [Methylobacter sp.]MDP3053136.1 type 4a pilus biogenesis protein PilO [Methylobacter sp.]MDP3363946.1 type 4a pilus biogenesis protein PilO [Methylobacter sp.]
MNLSEINWDPNAAGTWPLPIKAATIVLVCGLVFGAGVYYDTLDQLAELETFEQKEVELKQSFETKQKKAINLEDYQQQLEQIEVELEQMIRQMPTQEEVASLLIDISQTGLASGLEFRLFKPEAPVRKDFYSELPIKIEVIGKYEELGLFISGLASLPRIVTVHDVNIIPEDKEAKGGKMRMNALVKTYNEAADATESTTVKKKRGQK